MFSPFPRIWYKGDVSQKMSLPSRDLLICQLRLFSTFKILVDDCPLHRPQIAFALGLWQPWNVHLWSPFKREPDANLQLLTFSCCTVRIRSLVHTSLTLLGQPWLMSSAGAQNGAILPSAGLPEWAIFVLRSPLSQKRLPLSCTVVRASF